MRLPLDITEGGGGMTGHRSPLLLTARITMKFTTAVDAAWDCISGGTTSRRGQAARHTGHGQEQAVSSITQMSCGTFTDQL